MSYGNQNELLAAYKQGAADIVKRRNPPSEFRKTLKTLRAELNLSQREFAEVFGIAFSNLKNWEQPNRGAPKGVADLYIRLILQDPETIRKMVAELNENQEDEDSLV